MRQAGDDSYLPPKTPQIVAYPTWGRRELYRYFAFMPKVHRHVHRRGGAAARHASYGISVGKAGTQLREFIAMLCVVIDAGISMHWATGSAAARSSVHGKQGHDPSLLSQTNSTHWLAVEISHPIGCGECRELLGSIDHSGRCHRLNPSRSRDVFAPECQLTSNAIREIE
jgi:hypothetical protein